MNGVLPTWGPTTSAATGAHLTAGAEVAAAAGESTGIFTIDGVPYWIIYAAAFLIVLVRAQATYWVGRGVARGTGNTQWARRLESERAQRAIATINKWGPIAVTLSFFTVGVQTVINLTAGYTRMRLSRYLAALLPGCAIWAAIWTTIGIATFNAAVLLAARSPVGLAVIVLVLVSLLVWGVMASRRRHARVARSLAGTATTTTASGGEPSAPDAPTNNPFGDVADLLLDPSDDTRGTSPAAGGPDAATSPPERPRD